MTSDPSDPAADTAPEPAIDPAAPDETAAATSRPDAAPTDAVAAAVAELDDVADRPLAEHPDAFERVHGSLRQALAEIDDA